MVSSFHIVTNIRVPLAVRERFNALSGKTSPHKMDDDSHKVKHYFDQGFGSDGVKVLDMFLAGKLNDVSEAPIKYAAYVNNWQISEEGILEDACEKFHGAISMLQYFIDTFFEPEGIKLSGTIVGVNTERPILYVYHVKDNVITLDEPRTRKYLEVYSFLDEKVHDGEEWDTVYQMIDRDVF